MAITLPTPRLGQGTWQMECDDRAGAIAALRCGIDLGLSHIDTAEMYADGEVEELVGEAISGRRDEIFLASKVLPHNANYDGTIAACERSLRRLGVEQLDLYMLHWPGQHPIAETLRAFESLVEQGKIARYGVSNFDVQELDEALSVCGEGKLACNQVLYHLQERSIEHAVLPWCNRHGVPLVAYSPLGCGHFVRGPARAELLRVADKHGASGYQVALAYLMRDPNVYPIPKAARVEHLRDNAAALELVLDASDFAAIDAACPLGPPPTLLPVI